MLEEESQAKIGTVLKHQLASALQYRVRLMLLAYEPVRLIGFWKGHA